MSLQLTMDAGEAEDVMYVLADYISEREPLLNDEDSWRLDPDAWEEERANLATAIRFHDRLADLLGLTDETPTNQQGG
jgi:hypothetical protein